VTSCFGHTDARPPPLFVLPEIRVALPEGGERHDRTMTPDGRPATARAR
jgi:hypothetical protein